MIHCVVDLQLDGTFSSQDKESDEVDGQIIDSEVSSTKLLYLVLLISALKRFSSDCCKQGLYGFWEIWKVLAPVVQRVDNAIQRISIGKTNYAICWIVLSTL